MKSCLLLLLLLGTKAICQPSISFSPVLSGLSTPVDVVEERNDLKRLFIVEQPGTIRIVNGSSVLAKPFLDVSSLIIAGGERGLLSLAFHPDYATNGYVYVWYNAKPNGAVTLGRFTRSSDSNDSAAFASGVVLLQIEKRFSNHNGAKLNFGSDGYLYFGTGDGGSGGDPDDNGQDSTTLLAKFLRIDVNNPNPPYYSIPPTNPFANSTTARPEIIGLGLRNPWRWSFDKLTGDLWLPDVGQNLWEEVNMVPAADRLNKNFGWSCYESAHPYKSCTISTNLVTPIFEYDHDNNTGGHSITGGYVYRGTEYPALQGYYLCTDYVSANGWLIKPNGAGGYDVTMQRNWEAGITSFGERSNGDLYTVTGSGGLFKVVAGDILPVKLVSFNVSAAGENHHIAWNVQNEQSGDEYTVEQRTDPQQPFAPVRTLKAERETLQKTYEVQVPATTANTWYRLHIKTVQGNSIYSPIVSITSNSKSKLKAVIISNTIQVTLPPKARMIKLYDSNGKLLLSKAVTNSIAERISLQNFARGIVALQVQTDDGAQSIQLLY